MISDYRDCKSKVYKFLEHPLSFWSIVYHLVIFAYILVVHSLCAFAEIPLYKWLASNVEALDLGLAVIFICEFFIRLWSVGADARYTGWTGRFRYLTKFISVIDMIILVVTIFILNERDDVTENLLAKLHFIQILRLFHIDRQMSTWRLVKELILKSREELITAYYLTFVVFLFLATFVYTVETFFDEEIDGQLGNSTNPNPTFKNYGESLWFSIISILTVGLVSHRKMVEKMEVFKYHCGRLKKVDENWQQAKNLRAQKKLKTEEIFRKKTLFAPLEDFRKKTCSSLTTLAFTNNLARKHGVFTFAKHKLSEDLDGQLTVRSSPNVTAYRKLTLPSTGSFSTLDELEKNLLGSQDNLVQENHIDAYESQASSLLGSEIEINKLDEINTEKYRPILRLVYFIKVVWLKKKFYRLRKPHNELIDVEEELCEMEFQNRKKLNELEYRLNATIGVSTASPLSPYGKEKCSIQKRLELCEDTITIIDQKFSDVMNFLELMEAEIINPNRIRME